MSVRTILPPSRFAVLSALLLAGAAGLAGCASPPDTVGTIPDDYRTRHPITVREATRDLDIFVASSDTRLTLPDETRVEDFTTRFRASRASVIRVQLPSGTRNAAAARLVTDSIVRVLARRGVPRSRVIVTPYAAGELADAPPVRLSYNAVVAEVEPCGRWPDDLGNTEQNRNYYNFGCATQSNLAAQISDPRDLLGPRGMSEIDAERRTTVIGDYRTGANTASDRPRTESSYEW